MAKRHSFTAVSVALAASAGIAACTGNSDRTSMSETSRTQSEPQDQEQEISREVTPGQSDLGGTAVEKGEKEVEAQREVVTKRTETLSEDVPTVTTGQQKLDLNRMDTEDFVVLGLDQSVAQRIVDYREKNGPFKSIDELSNIQGIDQNWLNQYRDRFAFVSEESQQGDMAGTQDKREKDDMAGTQENQ